MAEDINHVVLVGRLTKDSELRYTPSGFAICKMSLAVNRRRKQGDQWIDEGNFFDVTLLGKRGESLNPYLKKGQQLAIDGNLKQERWEQNGAKRSKVTIEAKNIQLLGGNNSSGGNSSRSSSQGGGSNPQNSQPSYQPQDDRFEDEIPF